MAKENKENQNKNKPTKKNPYSIYWIYAAIGIAIIGIQLFMSSSTTKELQSKQTFLTLMEEGFVENTILWRNVGRVDFKINESGITAVNQGDFSGSDFEVMRRAMNNSGKTLGTASPQFSFDIASTEAFIKEFETVNDKRKADGFDVISYRVDEEHNYIGQIFSFLLPIIIIIAIWMFIMKRMSGGGAGGAGGQIFNIGKSKAKVFEKGKGTDVTFKDVAGLEGAKEEVEEIVNFLKNPSKYTELGAKIPKGAILVGPPGTGKTLLAKAVAGEADVPFFSLSGSDFVEMFVGVGASRVRDLFKQAKEKAPSIIFIDEIDAIGRARGKNNNMGSNDERENTLNQLLTEMDGFGTNSGVIILAATNRADVLDKALMRAGRFDRQIYVDMPDLNERRAIFKVHLKPIKTDKEMDVEFLAKQTPGFSGADIANLCNEAALIAARKDKKAVEKQDFLDAVDRIVGGLEKKNKIITKDEKRSIAFHEAGHAAVSWLAEHAHPLVKVTIVPRGQSLGAAWYLPEERSITTTEQLLDEMCAALGGRAAEEITFGKISTGALSDLEKVTKQAYAMVSVYGLNKVVGNISFYDSQGQNQFTKPYSEETARIIDQEVSKLIEEQYQRAKDILTANQDKLNLLASKLLEKEVIFKEDLIAIFGERPWDKLSDIEKIKLAGEHAEVSADDANVIEDDAEKPASTNGSVNTENSDKNSNEDVEEDKKMDS
ncbi:ATP-dependent zinc metalloprotease FtsH [Brumimicrobium glaciale]|jgi:cell division protease FtsH|uniref:ATP-dependent zinc metalloprotease FtsH n=1 Tax=Brumimicrobium glaciale TaxID=200475 RepID=A0A4Q4KII3_9FLAO|nr:ATP-dependent zinc metalloprotease FtsH [Brumimicrobium glaciale]RYM32975.1 ATP-dependent zinc metalloprotease FtsH [Brumimicrobium glaciale]